MVDHVMETKYQHLPKNVVKAAKVFLLDTFACALAGSSGRFADEAFNASLSWGINNDTRVWGRGKRLPHTSAAILNAYQIHCLEFDCVHEGGVLHPISTLTSAMMTEVDRQASMGNKINGKNLIEAIALGIDVSCSIASSSNAPMRFFRPALTGGFGATVAVAKLRQFSKKKLHNALGLYYGQAGGNMQAHIEGSALLGLQVGFGARNALVACDLADVNIEGPKDFLTGKYGYLPLMEGDYNLEPIWSEWGKIFRLSEVGHKPFPSGRLTHYAIDGLQRIMNENSFSHRDIEKVICEVPPLTMRLVGRPAKRKQKPNYAKLCLGYVCATTLIKGTVDQEDFLSQSLGCEKTYKLAKKVQVINDNNEDLNAFGPQKIIVILKNRSKYEKTIKYALGDPKNPLNKSRQMQKFWNCWQLSKEPLRQIQGKKLIKSINNLEKIDDTSMLIDQICP